jgi:hypothetical protein
VEENKEQFELLHSLVNRVQRLEEALRLGQEEQQKRSWWRGVHRGSAAAGITVESSGSADGSEQAGVGSDSRDFAEESRSRPEDVVAGLGRDSDLKKKLE